MEAKRIDSVIKIVGVWAYAGDKCAEVDCRDSSAYCALPAAIELEGEVLGRTGWNSDLGRAYFKRSCKVAKKV